MVWIFKLVIWTYLEKFIGIKSHNTKQRTAELSPWFAPKYPSFDRKSPLLPLFLSFLLSTSVMDCPVLSLFAGNTVGSKVGDNPVQQQKIAHLRHQKKSPHQIVILIWSPYTSLIYSCSHCFCITFLTSGFMLTYIMLILIKQRLLNLIMIMKNHSMVRISHYFSSPSNAIWKNLLQLLLVFLIYSAPFHSNFKSFLWSRSSWDSMADELIKYNKFQVTKKKPDETAYLMW